MSDTAATAVIAAVVVVVLIAAVVLVAAIVLVAVVVLFGAAIDSVVKTGKSKMKFNKNRKKITRKKC